MDILFKKKEKNILFIVAAGFVVYCIAFIYRSSFFAVDGRRYFCLFDDAMISMRYAWNFSHGSGLVWNQGEYVQGYTNLLMTLLMSLSTFIFDKPTAVLFIQILGVFIMLTIAFVVMRISDHIFQYDDYRQSLYKILSFCCSLSYYPLVYWSLMGMETGLLTLMLLLGVLSAFNYTSGNSIRNLIAASVFLGLAYMTRNDSIIFAFLILMYIVWEKFVPLDRSDFKRIVPLLMSIGLYIVFVVSQSTFQYLYYGEILPNTYTLKLTGMALSQRVTNGLGFMTPFLIRNAFFWAFSSMAVIFEFQKRKLLLLFIAFSSISYEVYVGGDPWPYWRIVSPTIPLLAMLFLSSINIIVVYVLRIQAIQASLQIIGESRKRYISQILIISITLMGLFSINKQFFQNIPLLIKPWETKANEKHVNVAIVLNQLTTEDATIGVYSAGAIPYFVDRQVVDFLGKSDRYIAQLPPDVSGSVAWAGMNSVPGHNKYDLNYSIKTLQPTYVQDFQWGTQNLTQWAETHYVKVEYMGIPLFFLKDSPYVNWSKIVTP